MSAPPDEIRSGRLAVALFPVAILAAELFGTFFSDLAMPLNPWVITLLGVVMFLMGLILTPPDLAQVAAMPWAVLIGCAAQFLVMPLTGLLIALAMGLEPLLIPPLMTPLLLGMAARILPVVPWLAMVVLAVLIAGIMARTGQVVLGVAFAVFVAVVLHNGAALLWAGWRPAPPVWPGRNAARSRSRSGCRMPVWRRHWRMPISARQRRCPQPWRRSGTISAARSGIRPDAPRRAGARPLTPPPGSYPSALSRMRMR
ncbi:MAG: hypothetical protein Q4G14_13965 [Paracoccus sp. (in: a-proteobacteria)]|uniref:hypothetical protein n=1 Tax=Paracoccus sp. TaxID=267 RepID=UPI0026E111A8|nr:hypothetical protein [Paracoccus sp. (in: a-proteobacteria)]MDO5614332.1 hypothetical protein [Paracoccus sp. (in: a-proteobacteria)]